MRGARTRGLNSGDGDSESRVLTITPRDHLHALTDSLLKSFNYDTIFTASTDIAVVNDWEYGYLL